MFDPRQSYNTLLESGKLDALLAEARAAVKTSSVAGQPAAEPMIDVDAVVTSASAVADDLRKMAAAAVAQRAEKVAALLHLGRVATRLLA